MVMHAVRQKIKGGQAQETGRTEIRHDEGIVCGWLKGRFHDMNDIIFCICAAFYLVV
jgi:hypothetical protein